MDLDLDLDNPQLQALIKSTVRKEVKASESRILKAFSDMRDELRDESYRARSEIEDVHDVVRKTHEGTKECQGRLSVLRDDMETVMKGVPEVHNEVMEMHEELCNDLADLREHEDIVRIQNFNTNNLLKSTNNLLKSLLDTTNKFPGGLQKVQKILLEAVEKAQEGVILSPLVEPWELLFRGMRKLQQSLVKVTGDTTKVRRDVKSIRAGMRELVVSQEEVDDLK